MEVFNIRLLHQLGGGSFGTVYASSVEAKKLETADSSQVYAVKLLKPDHDKRARVFPDIFLGNAVRELCASPDCSESRSAFFGRVPFRSDVFFFHSSPEAEFLDSAAVLLAKYTCDCSTWFKTGTLTSGDITDFMLQLLQAVSTLHEDGVAHRDIKPANIFVNLCTGDVVLGDFGFASMLEGPLTHMPRSDICTLDTRAPEFCLDPGKMKVAASTKVDMWSVGMSLLCALLGKAGQPLGNVMDIADNREAQRALLRERFAGEFSPFGPDPGPFPSTVREWLARVVFSPAELEAAGGMQEAATTLPALSPAQALVLTKCLRLNPLERASAQDLLRAVCVNMPRACKLDTDRLRAVLIPKFQKLAEDARRNAMKLQAKGSLPTCVPVPPQHLLDGTTFAPGSVPPLLSPVLFTDPLNGKSKEAMLKDRLRLLKTTAITVRSMAYHKRSDGSMRFLRIMDTFLCSVDLFDRLSSPKIISRMAHTLAEVLRDTMVDGPEGEPPAPLASFVTSAAKEFPYAQRLLALVCINLADILLHYEGQTLSRIVYIMYHPNQKFFVRDLPDEVYIIFNSVMCRLVVSWTLEAIRTLDFDVVRPSLVRDMQKLGIHRNRAVVLGVCKALETTPSVHLALESVKPRHDPLDWDFSISQGSGPYVAARHAPFDVDF